MTLFATDLEALIWLLVISLMIYLLNKGVSFIFLKTDKISVKQKITSKFVLRILSVVVIVYMIIEGFPAFQLIDTQYTAIITGAVSTAIAFASSGVFSNLVSGIVLMAIRPIEVGDLVSIKGNTGVIRQIKLTKITMETFDNLFLEKSNSEVLSSVIENYTVKLGKKRSFHDFKRKILAPQDKGYIQLDSDQNQKYESELRNVYENYSKKTYPNLFKYTFKMSFPYQRFQLIIDEVDALCNKYQDEGIFKLKPRYDISDLGFKVIIKFRLPTFDVNKIFDYQPQFAGDVYNIIHKHRI